MEEALLQDRSEQCDNVVGNDYMAKRAAWYWLAANAARDARICREETLLEMHFTG